MTRYNYDRLSAQDNAFLLFENPSQHMHVTSTQVFDLGPLETDGAGVDYESIKRFTASVLFRIPRYRQRLKWIPLENSPVWVDDPHFNIDYHVRHTALPKPGSEAQLKQLTARILAQQLDRTRPLWEIWVIEGLEGSRFAIVSKIHHCMIDGSSGVDIGQILQSPTPDTAIPESPPFIPRPEPSRGDLLRDSMANRLSLPLRGLRNFRVFRSEAEHWFDDARTRVQGLFEAVAAQSQGASETPINGPLGPHRAVEWMRTPLEDLKALRRSLDCTVNDVVLTIVTGAFRDYLIRRQVRPEELDFRIQAPVSVRRESEKGKMGNRVSGWMVRLPLEESDPLRQLEAIHETTRDLKESKQAEGVDMMMSIMEVMPSALVSLGAQAASGAMNSIVTNVPGPQFPLFMLGAEMTDMFPQVPLLPSVGIGIALISYNGRVCWGFNADPDLVPDLDAFRDLMEKSVERVAEAADVKLAPPPVSPGRSRKTASD
ncbi:MAG: wax ester/triacylglycerol synthase family O-acyltransferase [Myxococcales bacterium]|nr:wax ester/triacylglycerol synthase family O-acyltransferase [Myxococcales bacterium]